MQQQQRQQQQEEERVMAAARAQAQVGQAPSLAPLNQQESSNFMDMDYDYDRPEPDNGHRPQSRVSQHSLRSVESENGHLNYNAGKQQRRTQQHPQKANLYAYQEHQFDEERGREDDDMW